MVAEKVTLPLLADAESAALLKVGELARRSGKTVRALHLYEELGLLRPVGRTGGGFRLYAPEAAGRVEWIGKLQEMGFSLHEIRAFLDDFEEAQSAPEAMERVRQIFLDKLRETRAHVARLQALEKDLTDSLAYLEVCHRCREPLQRSACIGCSRYEHAGDAPPLVAGLHLT